MKRKVAFRPSYTKFPVWRGTSANDRYGLEEEDINRYTVLPLIRENKEGVTEEDKDIVVALVKECWIEATVDDRWMVAYRLTPQNGVPIVAEVRLFPIQKESSAHQENGAPDS
jgi:hypothetical protein